MPGPQKLSPMTPFTDVGSTPRQEEEEDTAADCDMDGVFSIGAVVDDSALVSLEEDNMDTGLVSEIKDICRSGGDLVDNASCLLPARPADESWGLKVTLCMAKFKLGIAIDLRALVRAIPNSIYFGEAGSRYVMIRKLRHPRYVVAIPKCGNALIFTTYDGDEALVSAKRAARLVKKLYSGSAGFRCYEVCNVMLSAKAGCGVDVEAVGNTLNSDSPGPESSSASCHLRDVSAKRVLMDVNLPTSSDSEARHAYVKVGPSGHVSIYQCRSLREASSVLELLAPMLRTHRKWW